MRLTTAEGIAAIILAVSVWTSGVHAASAGDRPNILWISCEDTSPDLPMYGDDTARTPNLSGLANDGCVYENVFATSPVCSPSRSTIITGIYAATLGTQNHRSRVKLPDDVRCFPAYLRDAGYYCTNNSKTDYNFDVPQDAWDENSKKAHWRNRLNPQQPFFAVFNLNITHEHIYFENDRKFARQTNDIPPGQRVEPKDVSLPPYIPDTPVTRADWARMYNGIAQMDFLTGALLDQLKADGLATNTIVMFFSDHGRGLPRGKRWLYDSGIQVPLIVRWPGHVKAGSRNGELVSLIDFAPTMLNLAGVAAPQNMQGRVFMGPDKQPEPQYIYATRDRMDERYDMSRCVRDHRYKYIHNYYPEKPNVQIMAYLEKNPTIKELRRLHKAGKISGPAEWFFADHKPVDELYDTQRDPWEIHNLAGASEQAERLNTMRNAMIKWQIDIGDKGFEPEPLDQIAGPPRRSIERMRRSGESTQ